MRRTDHPSVTMWCMVKARMWSSSSRPRRSTWKSGPCARSRGRSTTFRTNTPTWASRASPATGPSTRTSPRHRSFDDLDRFATQRDESRPQHLVPADQQLDGLAERGQVQPPGQAENFAVVVQARHAAQLLDEPDPCCP